MQPRHRRHLTEPEVHKELDGGELLGKTSEVYKREVGGDRRKVHEGKF